METRTRSRKRAVRLKPDALGTLHKTMEERWLADANVGRPTWEYRAELLGSSVATARRALSNGGADRSTFELAFKRLGLVWHDDFCEFVQHQPETLPIGDRATKVSALRPASIGEEVFDTPKRLDRRMPLTLGISVTLSCLAAIVYFASASKTLTPNLTPAFNSAFQDGMDHFHRGDLAGAHPPLKMALELARKTDSAGSLSSALRLAGDLAAAEGRLPEARDVYTEALGLRNDLGQEQHKPAIYEALGDVQTRLGDYRGARGSLTLALVGYERGNDPVGVAMARRDLGSLAYQTGDFGSAESLLKSSLESLKGLSKTDLITDVRGRLGLVWLKRGRALEARDAQQSCLSYWTSKKHPRWTAVCELRLGLADEALGDMKAASTFVSRSRDDFIRVGDRAGSSEAAEQLRRLLARQSPVRGPGQTESLWRLAMLALPSSSR